LSTLNAQSFSGADCETDHYLVVAKVWGTLTVRKQAAQKCDVDRFISGNKESWSLETVSDSDLKQICSFGELQ
jgi:hypothetical protein